MKKATLFLIIVLLLLLLFSNYLSSQNIKYDIPQGYEIEITETEYRFLVDQSISEISKYFEVDYLLSGEVILKPDQPYSKVNLHNLILKCKNQDIEIRKEIIKEHFAIMANSMNHKKELNYENIDSIRQFLSIRIYEEDYATHTGGKDSIVTKTDLQGTLSILMLDLPDIFTPVKIEIFNLWKISKNEAFEIAQHNISKHKYTKYSEIANLGENNIEIHILEEPNYAASMVLDMKNNCPEFIGEWGSLVTVPNKEIALICEISKENPLDFVLFIQNFKELIDRFYYQHPQRISKDFYWYYNNKFTKFIIEDNNKEEINVISPIELSKLMSN